MFRITVSIADVLSSLKVEKISHKDDFSWKEDLNSLINIEISELSKEKKVIQHKNQNVNNLIIYSDDSKCEKTDNLKAGVFYIKNFSAENSESLSWSLNLHTEMFDAELFALKKAFKLAFNKIFFFTKDIWIFSDSQAAIQRLQKSSLKTEQSHVLIIENWIEKIKTKHQIDIHLSWISGHMNITGNELADQTAKKEAELQQTNTESVVSLFY